MVMQSQEAELLTCQSVNVCSFYGGIKSKSANFRYSLKPQVPRRKVSLMGVFFFVRRKYR